MRHGNDGRVGLNIPTDADRAKYQQQDHRQQHGNFNERLRRLANRQALTGLRFDQQRRHDRIDLLRLESATRRMRADAQRRVADHNGRHSALIGLQHCFWMGEDQQSPRSRAADCALDQAGGVGEPVRTAKMLRWTWAAGSPMYAE